MQCVGEIEPLFIKIDRFFQLIRHFHLRVGQTEDVPQGPDDGRCGEFIGGAQNPLQLKERCFCDKDLIHFGQNSQGPLCMTGFVVGNVTDPYVSIKSNHAFFPFRQRLRMSF
jgi:hypothetical protein